MGRHNSESKSRWHSQALIRFSFLHACNFHSRGSKRFKLHHSFYGFYYLYLFCDFVLHSSQKIHKKPTILRNLRPASQKILKFVNILSHCLNFSTNVEELKITPILDKLLEYKRNWIQHVNRMPRNRLPRVTKHYSPSGRRNYGRPLKETSGYVRPERVNKWPNCMTDIWWWWWW